MEVSIQAINMLPLTNNQPQQGEHQAPLPKEISNDQKILNEAAHKEAEKDMDNDAELTAHSPNDDLDEGETARLGEEIPDII